MKRALFIFLLYLLLGNVLISVSALSLGVHVPEKYTDVKAGERFHFEIEVKYPENPERKDLRLEYEILTIKGDLISQSKALKAIETQASFIDFIVIPGSVEGGLHTINVKVTDYESLNEEVSATFHVEGKGTDQIVIYFAIILGAIILVGILIIFSLFRRRI